MLDAAMEMVLLTCAAAGGVVAAVVGLWNAHQLTRLTGRVDELGIQLKSHINAPGLHN